MYTTKNFKTKKELKAAVEAYNTISPVDGQKGKDAALHIISPDPSAAMSH